MSDSFSFGSLKRQNPLSALYPGYLRLPNGLRLSGRAFSSPLNRLLGSFYRHFLLPGGPQITWTATFGLHETETDLKPIIRKPSEQTRSSNSNWKLLSYSR